MQTEVPHTCDGATKGRGKSVSRGGVDLVGESQGRLPGGGAS